MAAARSWAGLRGTKQRGPQLLFGGPFGCSVSPGALPKAELHWDVPMGPSTPRLFHSCWGPHCPPHPSPQCTITSGWGCTSLLPPCSQLPAPCPLPARRGPAPGGPSRWPPARGSTRNSRADVKPPAPGGPTPEISQLLKSWLGINVPVNKRGSCLRGARTGWGVGVPTSAHCHPPATMGH